jgi:sensor c-di-GMP phosphodiesterase-like protein
VAEGIDVEAQRETLLALGCKIGPGYVFGQPMPIEEVFDAAVTRRRGLLVGNLAGAIDFSPTGRFRGI